MIPAMEDAIENANERSKYVNVGYAEDALEATMNLHVDDIRDCIDANGDLNYVMSIILTEFIVNIRRNSIDVDFGD